MIKINKNVGETPLELINRIRIEMPDLKNERLSYAGRLDPMAEGQMLILVGDENDDREKYLGLDKEYEAEFLVGVSTDSGDILGKITEIQISPRLGSGQVNPKQTPNPKSQILKLKSINEQKYPWFSGKTVNGKKLFEYFKEGKTDIERPSLKVEIKEVNLLILLN
jgi:tRNA pseudouridine55 synthase